ncbi:terpene synthase family protein [Streptomyces fenghuangensis]|uniref:terpene synthase family protein n=1 Tax=Streptomyces sp. ICN903 TaxID=2964654 RepID=UPI001ED9D760|nr:terpene synthase family protein [Streptomyces sp. ICN903]MCG3039608.1 terpene synthase family protein [Streptomyces sp. ICN903]
MSSSTTEVGRSGIPAQPGSAPRFYYPSPMPEIPHVPADVAAQVQAWKGTYDFFPREPGPAAQQSRGNVLAWCLGRFSTQETSKAVLHGIGCMIEWALIIDDEVLDHADAPSRRGEIIRLVGRITHVLESPGYRVTGNDNPYVVAVHDVMEQLRAECTPTQIARLTTGLRCLLTSGVHKLHLDEPTEDEYLAVRMHDIGSSVYASWIEMCGPAPIPDEEWNAPAVQALIMCTTLLVAVENDIASYHKEKTEGQTSPNFVSVLQAARGISFEQAVAAAIETRDRLMLLFLRLRERLMPSAEPPLQYLIERLGHFIVSNTEANLCAPRYNPSPAGRMALEDVVKTPACWAPSLSTTNTGPLPYPSTSWWWDHC